MFKTRQWIGLVLGLLALATIPFFDFETLSLAGKINLAIFVMAGIFWILEPIPIYATSVLVIFLQVLLLSDKSPLVQALSPEQLSAFPVQKYTDFYNSLSNPIIMLFLGGFALASAAVKFRLDKNLTRVLLKPFGKKPEHVTLGLMLVTGTLSAFMSNTATTAMMITVVIPIVMGLKTDDPFRKAVALAIPVGANIGGIATPIGTPPNAIALSALAKNGIHIPFSTWMIMMIPLVIVMILVAWRALLFFFPPNIKSFELEMTEKFDRSPKAICAYLVFGLTVLLWVTEKIHGISSNVVAFLPIAMLPSLGVIHKNDIRSFSWDVLWLMAGGISLGLSLKTTGLASWMVNLVDWTSLGGFGLVAIFGLVGFIIANLVSHTVSATILIPLAVSLTSAGTVGEGFNSVVGIITVGIIVSFSMLLPISTPPNAIAMSTNMVETKDLVVVGAVVGVVSFVLTLLCGQFYWPLICN
jgi:solute carrier family 13 (sodium-dependent dicarboxylate transporter), member 2/3/5